MGYDRLNLGLAKKRCLVDQEKIGELKSACFSIILIHFAKDRHWGMGYGQEIDSKGGGVPYQWSTVVANVESQSVPQECGLLVRLER